MITVTERTFFKEDSIRRRAEQIFNLRSDASKGEIRKGYRRLVTKYHPDRNPHDRFSKQKTQLVLQAYNLLMRASAHGDTLSQYDLLEDDRLVKSILPKGVEPEPLGQSYEEWHRKQFYEGYFY